MKLLLVLVSFVTLAWAGTRPINPDIIGGEAADATKNLHAVSIQYGGKHICGGSVLKPDTGKPKTFVLTAAHCVYKLAETQLTVLVGRQKLSGSGGQEVKVEEKHVHKEYDPFDLLNDIAVLKVAEITAKTTELTTVETNEAVQDDTEYQLAGWGETDENGGVSDDLKIINQKTSLTPKACKDVSALITDEQFCAQTIPTNPDKGACSGDAGSPLMALDPNGPTTKQVGILSWGFGCANNKPDIYTNVNKYTVFISSVVNPT